MKQFFLISALICGFAISSNALQCYQTAQNTGSTSSVVTCNVATFYCYRMTSALTAAQVTAIGTSGFASSGAGFLATALAVSDKGCFPSYGRVGIAQTLLLQGVMGTNTGAAGAAAVTAANIQTGLVNIYTNICVTSGYCCTTNLCNSSYILIRNMYLISLLLSIAVVKLIF